MSILQSWTGIDPTTFYSFWHSIVLGVFFNTVAGFVYAAVLYFAVFKKMLVCREKWCFRLGHHKVEGTHYRTCPKHTNQEVHTRLQHQHFARHTEAHKFLNKGEK